MSQEQFFKSFEKQEFSQALNAEFEMSARKNKRRRKVKQAIQLSDKLKALEVADSKVLDNFWREYIQGKNPIIEKSTDDNTYDVYFFWRGDSETRNVYLHCGVTGDELSELKRIGHSHYFYLTMKLPGELRTLYSFLPNLDASQIPHVSEPVDFASIIARNNFFRSVLQPDPANTLRQVLYDGDEKTYSVKSVIEMPKVEPQTWIRFEPKVWVGTVEKHILRSAILKEDRVIWVYKPYQ